jgi:RHS repeat-associated protein
LELIPLETRVVPTTDILVNTYTTNLQIEPAIAMDGAGDFVVTWASYGEDGSGMGIYAQRYAAGGTPLGSEFRVNTYTTSQQWKPAVAMDSSGDFVVAWESLNQDGSMYGIYAQRYAADGTPAGSEFRVNNNTINWQWLPSVAMDAAGDFVIAWTDNYFGSTNHIYAQRYAADGTPQGSEFQVTTYPTLSQAYPSVAMDTAGTFVIAWEGNSDGSGLGVYAQRYAADGTAQGSEFQINTYTTNDQAYPSVAMDATGDFIVAWQSGYQDGSGYGVYARRYAADGTSLGSEFQVNTSTAGNQSLPSVGVDAAGDFVVAWQYTGAYGVYAQGYAADGTPQGTEFRINTYTGADQADPSVAMDGVGDFMVAWAGGEPEDFGGIFLPGEPVSPPPPPPPPPPMPPAFVPDWAASPSSSIGGMAAGSGANEPAMGDGVVRYTDGTVILAQTDLWSDGFGTGWGQARAWTNTPGYANQNQTGAGWVNAQQPHLVTNAAGTTVAVVRGGTRADYFDLVGTVWTERFFGQDRLFYDAASHEFELIDSLGTETWFYDFSTSTPAAQQGQFAAFNDAAGNAVSTSYTGGGQLSEVTRSATVGGVTTTESLLYAYLTGTDPNAGLVSAVTLRRKVGAGSYATVRSVAYVYYNGTEAHGNLGDLKTATVEDASGTPIDTSYYRYYTSADAGTVGYAHGLKYQLTGPSYDRLTADLGTGVDGLTDAQVAPYADRAYQYNPTSHRVTQAVIAGAGGDATGGLGTYSYAYTASANASGVNAWRTKTVVTTPEGNTDTVYTNAFGQVMLDAYTETATGQAFDTFYRYDAAGRLVLEAAPSAVSGYDDGYDDLVDYVSGNAIYLRDSDGVLTKYTYAGSTTATDTTAGDAAGYLTGTDLLHGEAGTPVPQETRTYVERTAYTTLAFYFPAASTVYRNDDGTGGQTTTTTYTWQGSTAMPTSVTVTQPAVTTAENGPNSATSTVTVFDPFGRPEWAKDPAGFLTYTAYDTPTGAVVKAIADVNTAYTGDFADLPSGWATPTGGGLHLVTTAAVDALGRATAETDPDGNVTYTVYNDPAHEVSTYAGWDATAGTPTGPTVVVRADRAHGYTETLTISAAPNLAIDGSPDGTEAVTGLQSLARDYTNAAGQVVYSDAYFDLTGLTYSTGTSLGTAGVNFYRTAYGYDGGGRQARAVSPQGTVTRTVYDGQGRAVSDWVGTDDTPTTGAWSPANLAGTDLADTADYQYDGGGVGDGNLTLETDHPGGGAADRVTQTWYDWRDRAVAAKAGVQTTEATDVNRPLVVTTYDNLDEATRTQTYDGDGVTPTISGGVLSLPTGTDAALRAQAGASYDELGRVYRADTYAVDPSSGSVGLYTLHADTWYDSRGNVLKTLAPGGLVTKYAYDGAGQVTTAYTSDGGGDTGYADADDVTGDTVLEQVESVYDADGNETLTTDRQRLADATGTGALGTATSGVHARVTYAASYYDAAGRDVADVDVGTNGGSAWTRPASVPLSSGSVLVTNYAYDAAGNVEDVTAFNGIVTRTLYDALGRTTRTVEDYTDGTPTSDTNKTTEYTYTAAGMATLTAVNPDGVDQTTAWVYGVTTAGGSAVDSNDVAGATEYPDPTTGAASSSQEDVTTVNALGQTVTSTDRNGTTHTLTYDVVGRVVSDAVTTLGTGVDGSVRRVETAYDGQGNPYLITSYDAASGGSVVNQVERAYNGLGQLTTEWQAASGAVNTSTSPAVRYAYSDMAGGADHSRLTSVTDPSGYELTYTYASGPDDGVSRLSSLSDATGTLEAYSYLGPGTVVGRSHPQPGIDQSYVLDSLGRVYVQSWENTSTSTATDEFRYFYGSNGNLLTRANAVDSSFDEWYQYDDLGQLTGFTLGTGHTEGWGYDAMGNWAGVTVDGGAPQARGANAQNEITSIGGATSPAYDAAGNMTGDETGRTFVYDAWNRLVAVKSGSTTLETFSYDGLNRRVTNAVGGTTTTLFYSAQQQVLEEKVGSNTSARYVWSPVYVNALVLRDRDTNGDGTLDERLWVQQDANWNVTALVDGSGAVVERYVYDPFGAQTVLTGGFGSRSSSSYGWLYGFQGERVDPVTGNLSMQNRDYDVDLGRFTSLDPIGFAGGNANQYGFVENNPVTSTDPTGLYDPLTGSRCTGGYGLGPGLNTLGPTKPSMPLSLSGFLPQPLVPPKPPPFVYVPLSMTAGDPRSYIQRPGGGFGYSHINGQWQLYDPKLDKYIGGYRPPSSPQEMAEIQAALVARAIKEGDYAGALDAASPVAGELFYGLGGSVTGAIGGRSGQGSGPRTAGSGPRSTRYVVTTGLPPSMPSYTLNNPNGRASGLLVFREGGQTRFISLASGVNNATDAGLAGARNLPGANRANWHHVEFQALEIMRERGITSATLLHNYPTGLPCGACMPIRGGVRDLTPLQSSLAKGSELSIFGLVPSPPGNASPWMVSPAGSVRVAGTR